MQTPPIYFENITGRHNIQITQKYFENITGRHNLQSNGEEMRWDHVGRQGAPNGTMHRKRPPEMEDDEKTTERTWSWKENVKITIRQNTLLCIKRTLQTELVKSTLKYVHVLKKQICDWNLIRNTGNYLTNEDVFGMFYTTSAISIL